jgi:hypothetical protein
MEMETGYIDNRRQHQEPRNRRRLPVKVRITTTAHWERNTVSSYKLEFCYDDPILDMGLRDDAAWEEFAIPRLRGSAKLHLENGELVLRITSRWEVKNQRNLRPCINRMVSRGWKVIKAPQPQVMVL